MSSVVNVEVGIANCVQVVDSILSRRKNRKEDFLHDLRDDLEAVSEIVSTLDNLFIDLVMGFTNKKIISDPELLQDHIRSSRDYLTKRELLRRFEELQGTISGAAYTQKLRSKEYRELVQPLRSLVKRLAQYRYELGEGAETSVGHMQEWNLQTLCERAEKRPYGGGVVDIAISEMAEEVFLNHDFDHSDSIHRLIGNITLHTKTVML